jgi:cytochrome c
MSNLNLNKAAAAILVAGLIGMITGKVTDTLYFGSPEGNVIEKGAKRGYTVEGADNADAAGDAAAAPVTADDISALYATADVKAGEDFVNKKCTVCHDVSKGGSNKVGPHLWGVVNRPIASISDFNYSSAMKQHAADAKTWTVDNLAAFIWSPQKTDPGTMMGFQGIPKDQERANVIAYIATKMTDSPAKLPAASAKPAAKAVDAGKAAADAKVGAKLDAGTAPNPNVTKKLAPAPNTSSKAAESIPPAGK